MRRGWLSVFSTLAIGFVWLAPPLCAQFVYVANSESNNVSAYRIGADGFLMPVPGSPVSAGNTPVSVAVDPTAKFAYVVNFRDHTVSAYTIGTDGALTPIPGSPFNAGATPSSVAVDPTAKFAYVTLLTGDGVLAYRIEANGALKQISAFAKTGGSPISVAVDPTGNFAYVANRGVNNVSAFGIGADGSLTPVTGSPFKAGADPVSVAVDPTGKFAYVANEGERFTFEGNVSAYRIDADGALTPVPGSPFAPGKMPDSVAVDPTGKFAYVANGSGNTVSAYSIGTDGALTTVPGSPFAAGFLPMSVAVDPTGKFVYVANRKSGDVWAYRIHADGGLTPVTGSPFKAGDFPFSVAVTPLVPFASSFAKLEIAKDRFHLNEPFALGANSNGINPLTENVTLQIDTFSVRIPAGSFKKTFEGTFAFDGVVDGVSLEVKIVPLGNNIFTFKAVGTGVDLTGLSNPVTLVLTIGIDSGTTTVTAQFQ